MCKYIARHAPSKAAGAGNGRAYSVLTTLFIFLPTQYLASRSFMQLFSLLCQVSTLRKTNSIIRGINKPRDTCAVKAMLSYECQTSQHVGASLRMRRAQKKKVGEGCFMEKARSLFRSYGLTPPRFYRV